jgi:hypothetical protein
MRMEVRGSNSWRLRNPSVPRTSCGHGQLCWAWGKPLIESMFVKGESPTQSYRNADKTDGITAGGIRTSTRTTSFSTCQMKMNTGRALRSLRILVSAFLRKTHNMARSRWDVSTLVRRITVSCNSVSPTLCRFCLTLNRRTRMPPPCGQRLRTRYPALRAKHHRCVLTRLRPPRGCRLVH